MKRLLLTLGALLFLTVGAEAASRFAVCTATCTWDNSSTLMWSTTSGGATGASAPTTTDDVTFDAQTCVGGVTCTATVNANIDILSLSFNCAASTTGCILDFSVNNNTVNLRSTGTALSTTGSGNSRTLKMGSGAWSLTGAANGNVINSGNSTNLTVTGSAVISITSNTVTGNVKTIILGGSGGTPPTYNISLLSSGSQGGYFQFAGSTASIGTLSIATPNYVAFSSGVTYTITTMTATGTASNQIGIVSNSLGNQAIISSATNKSFSWVGLRDISASGGGTFTATNSFDLGHNSGITITGPSSTGTACILGGWLLWRDMPEHINDNFPAWLDKAA